MPLELSRHVTKSFPSLSTFEYLIYFCDYGSIKPELAIYRNCLELLKAAPQDILYLDDRAENVEAAARLGALALPAFSIMLVEGAIRRLERDLSSYFGSHRGIIEG